MSVLLCCCCGGFEASKPNGLCEYCASLCISRRLKGLGCKVLEDLHVADTRGKGFPCTFFVDVICKYKKCACSRIVVQCFKCAHYFRFMQEMDDEEERFFDEDDRLRKGL